MALKLPTPPPTPRLCPWRGFLVCGDFSSFTAPSQRCRSHPYSFVSLFSLFFCPTQVRGDFLAFWEFWGLLPAFSRCSLGVVPHVDVILMHLWGGRWYPRLTPPTILKVPLMKILNFSLSVNLKGSYMPPVSYNRYNSGNSQMGETHKGMHMGNELEASISLWGHHSCSTCLCSLSRKFSLQ